MPLTGSASRPPRYQGAEHQSPFQEPVSQKGRPENQEKTGVCGLGHWVNAGVCGHQEGVPSLGDCSWTLMPQEGHNHFGSSGSVTSEKVMRLHKPARASVPLVGHVV